MSTLSTFSPLRTEIGGIEIRKLAREFGTPTYVYDAAKISERIADLKAFDVVRYAMKACSNLAILDLMRRSGVLVDSVSAGEIGRAMAAGYAPTGDPPPIVYTADIFDDEALEMVVKLGLHVNCGSPDMIEQLGRVAPGRHITLRLNPGFGHGHSQKTNTGGEQSKHGIWHAELDACLRAAEHHGLAVTGLHMHIGSGTDFEHLSQVCNSMEQAALEAGRVITSISAGGGLPIADNAGDEVILRRAQAGKRKRPRAVAGLQRAVLADRHRVGGKGAQPHLATHAMRRADFGDADQAGFYTGLHAAGW